MESGRVNAWDVPALADEREQIERYFAEHPTIDSIVFSLLNSDARTTVAVYRDGTCTFGESREGHEPIVPPWRPS